MQKHKETIKQQNKHHTHSFKTNQMTKPYTTTKLTTYKPIKQNKNKTKTNHTQQSQKYIQKQTT